MLTGSSGTKGDGEGKGRTLSVHRQVEIFDIAIGAEDLVEVRLGDVLGEFFDDDLQCGQPDLAMYYLRVNVPWSSLACLHSDFVTGFPVRTSQLLVTHSEVGRASASETRSNAARRSAVASGNACASARGTESVRAYPANGIGCASVWTFYALRALRKGSGVAV